MNDSAIDKKLRASILDLSRQNRIGALSPWFSAELDARIQDGSFLNEDGLDEVSDKIVADLRAYRAQTGVETVVLGMSGGVDSALTAALFKRARYRVIGVTMPIHQDQAETDRGIEACRALDIEHQHIDLTNLYNGTLTNIGVLDEDLFSQYGGASKATLIRRGNVRARLRMITLYNLASLYGGFVASTDNLSELAAGFWTLHGDVGDVAPIQSLWKSWEVPYLAKINGVPESTWRATPTDGLGIDSGDEAQLGASYLEWDLMVMAIHEIVQTLDPGESIATVAEVFNFDDARASNVFISVVKRMGSSWYKRVSPVLIHHALHSRYAMIDEIDSTVFRPAVVR